MMLGPVSVLGGRRCNVILNTAAFWRCASGWDGSWCGCRGLRGVALVCGCEGVVGLGVEEGAGE